MTERPHDAEAAEGAAAETVDVAANRRARKWTRGELARRALWEILRGPIFAWTPRPLWAWRRMVLRLFGARIGRRVHLYPTVRIAIPWTLTIGDDVGVGDGAILYSLGTIEIGARATISQYAHLCAGTHDYRNPAMPLMKQPIIIGAEAWICANAFIGPGVRVGSGSIAGAGAVVIRDIPERIVAAGNPAKVIKKRDQKSP